MWSNTWKVCKDATAQASHLKAGIKSMFAHVLSAFLEQFGFWVDVFLATSWNGIEILILKHMWKVKSDFLSRNKTKIEKVPFFRDTLYVSNFNLMLNSSVIQISAVKATKWDALPRDILMGLGFLATFPRFAFFSSWLKTNFKTTTKWTTRNILLEYVFQPSGYRPFSQSSRTK